MNFLVDTDFQRLRAPDKVPTAPPPPPPVDPDIPLAQRYLSQALASGAAVKPPQTDIDAVDQAGRALKVAQEGGDPAAIAEARDAYDDALMRELGSAYQRNDGAWLGHSVLLEDPGVLQVAAQQVVDDHPVTDYDPDFGASVNAAIIIKQAEYAAGGPDADVTPEQALAALQTLGEGLQTVEDPSGRTRAAVLADPAVQHYCDVIKKEMVSKDAHDGLPYLAETLATLQDVSPELAVKVAQTVLGDPKDPAHGTLLGDIKYASSSFFAETYYTQLDRIVTTLQQIPGTHDLVDTIENAMAERLRGDAPSQWFDSDYAFGEMDFKDPRQSPNLVYDLIDKLSTGPNARPDVVKELQDELEQAGQSRTRPTPPPTVPAAPTSPAPGPGAPLPPVSLAAPPELVSATDAARQRYDAALASGDPKAKADALSALHTAVAAEVNYAQTQLRAGTPDLPETEARDLAIKLVSEQYHPGQPADALRTTAQAAMVIDDARKASQGLQGLEADKARLAVLSRGTQTGSLGGLALYADNPAVVAQVMDDASTRKLLDDIEAHLPQDPAALVHELAQFANVSSHAPVLADRLMARMLPKIEAAIDQLAGNLKGKEDTAQLLKDLSDIASAVRSEGNPPAGSAFAAPHGQQIIDAIAAKLQGKLEPLVNDLTRVVSAGRGSAVVPGSKELGPLITELVGKGTDPTLLLRVAELERPHNAERATTIEQSVGAGIKDFYATTYPEALKASSESVAELTYLSVNFGPLVDRNDPAAMRRYIDFVNQYHKDHPEIGEKARVLEDYSTQAGKILTAAGNHHAQLDAAGVGDDVDTAFEQFFGDEAHLQAMQNSPGLVTYMARLDSQTNESFSAVAADAAAKNLRLGLQRFGSVSSKSVAVGAARLARQGDLNGALSKFETYNLKKYGLNETLYSQVDFDNTIDGLLKISYAQDNVGAAKVLLGQAVTPQERQIAQTMLDDANAELEKALAGKPKIGLTWDATTGRGFAMRGTGVALMLAGVWFALQSEDRSPYAWANIGAGVAGAGQTVMLLSAMSLRGLNNDATTLTSAAKFSKGVSLIDTWGDRMIIIGPALGVWSMVNDVQRGDNIALGIDAIGTAGGVAAFWGTQAWLGGGATQLGLVMSSAGLVLTIVAAVAAGAYMGYQQYQAVKASNQFEDNPATAQFLHDVVGIDNTEGHDLVKHMRNATHQGFGAGVVLQGAALMAGYDLEDSADVAAFKRYLNSLSEEQMSEMIEGAHVILDDLDADSQPSAERVSGVSAQMSFRNELQSRGVPLPPLKLQHLEPPAPPPPPAAPPPVIYTVKHNDDLWRIARAHEDLLLTDEERANAEGPNARTLLAVHKLAGLNPDYHFDMGLMDRVVSNDPGDPDTLLEGWKLTIRP